MSQIGAIVVDDSLNVNAWIAKIKAEFPKASVGNPETTAQGVKYIPIIKNA